MMYRQNPSAPRRMISHADPPMCTSLPSGPLPSIDQSSDDLGGIAGNEHMAHICHQRQAELDIALEYGSDLRVISDGSPVVRDEHRVRGVQGHLCLILPELNRLTSDGIMSSGSVGSGKDSDISGLLFGLLEPRCEEICALSQLLMAVPDKLFQ